MWALFSYQSNTTNIVKDRRTGPQAGTIVPNDKLGGSVNVTVNQDFRGADAGVFAKAQVFKEQIKRETLAAVTELLNSGGSFAKAAGRR